LADAARLPRHCHVAAEQCGDGLPSFSDVGFFAGNEVGATDFSTVSPGIVLRLLRYRTYGRRLGRNIGPTAGAVDGMRARFYQLINRFAQPASLMGRSLGGIYVRQFARRTAHAGQQVITIYSRLDGIGENIAFTKAYFRPPPLRRGAYLEPER
jgi:hypothetical protein